MKRYTCLLHPERESVADPQGLLICTECLERYQEERAKSLPFAQRTFLRRLIAVRHDLTAENAA